MTMLNEIISQMMYYPRKSSHCVRPGAVEMYWILYWEIFLLIEMSLTK